MNEARRQRKRASLSITGAARIVHIESEQLWRYECALESPPLRTIYDLLTAYKAEESAILFQVDIASYTGDLEHASSGRVPWRRLESVGYSDYPRGGFPWD